MMGTSSNEIYRLNLEEGTFLKPYEIGAKGVNKILHNQTLDLAIAACDDGLVSFIDLKNSKEVYLLNTILDHPITSITGGANPFEFIIGSQEGIVIHYDMRN
jgi:ribosome biogenesis protein ENP2